MRKTAFKLSLLSASLVALSACVTSNDTLFQPTNANNQSANSAVSPSYNMDANLPNLGTTVFEPINIAQGQNTGTFVGQKVISFRTELNNLQDAIKKHNTDLQNIRVSVNNNAVQYQNSIKSVETKLQAGTTPGNPYVVAAMQNAQNNIKVMNDNAISTSQLSTRVVSDVAMTSYVVNSIKAAYTVSGAVDEDHQQLKVLQNEAEKTNVVLNNILNEVNTDSARQQQYITSANKTVTSLEEPVRRGNLSGYPRSEPVNIAPVVSGPALVPTPVVPVNSYSMQGPAQSESFSNRPLLAIKFNRDNINYQDGLNRAVNGALRAKPTMMFDIVAVSPANSSMSVRTTARNKATEVFQEVIKAGVSPERVSLSAKSSPEAASPEVHVFVK